MRRDVIAGNALEEWRMESMPTDVRVPFRKSRVRSALGRVGRWTVVAIVVGLALIGFLHLTRGTAVRHVRSVSSDRIPIGMGEPEVPLMATMATGAWLAPGNRVQVLLNGVIATRYEPQASWSSRSGRSGSPRSISHRIARTFGASVIDSRVGWTGGFGIDDKWFGDGRTNGSWRETNVRFEGPAVRQLQAAFVAAWVEATGVMLTGHATLSPQENGVAAAGLLYTAPTLGSTAAERFVALSIAGARKTLYITNSYFAPERSFIDLPAAAAKRGVDVRILAAGPRTDVNIVRNAGRAWYGTLLDAGVRVFEWQPSTLHANTFVADGQWSTIGSMNFDNRSMALNDESTLIILDYTIGRQRHQIFVDDLRHAEEITLTTFRQRSWWARLTERAANFVIRLLSICAAFSPSAIHR